MFIENILSRLGVSTTPQTDASDIELEPLLAHHEGESEDELIPATGGQPEGTAVGDRRTVRPIDALGVNGQQDHPSVVLSSVAPLLATHPLPGCTPAPDFYEALAEATELNLLPTAGQLAAIESGARAVIASPHASDVAKRDAVVAVSILESLTSPGERVTTAFAALRALRTLSKRGEASSSSAEGVETRPLAEPSKVAGCAPPPVPEIMSSPRHDTPQATMQLGPVKPPRALLSKRIGSKQGASIASGPSGDAPSTPVMTLGDDSREVRAPLRHDHCVSIDPTIVRDVPLPSLANDLHPPEWGAMLLQPASRFISYLLQSILVLGDEECAAATGWLLNELRQATFSSYQSARMSRISHWSAVFVGYLDKRMFLRLIAILLIAELVFGLPSWITIHVVILLWDILVLMGPKLVFLIFLGLYVLTSPTVLAFIFNLLVMQRGDCDADSSWKISVAGACLDVTSADRHSVSHKESSRVRNNALAQIDNICSALHYRPYFILMTRRLLSGNAPRAGCPCLYTPLAEPMNHPSAYDLTASPMSLDDALVLIDRDYYVDMTEILMLARPVILFTFVPESACGGGSDYSFTFDEHGYLRGKVNGAQDWNHPLWDYPDDMVTVARRSIKVTHKIVRWQVADHRYIIFMLPAGSTICFQDISLPRYNPVSGRGIVVANGDTVSISNTMSYNAITLDLGVWEILVNECIARSRVPNVTVVATFNVESTLSQYCPQTLKEDKGIATAIYNVLKVIDLGSGNILPHGTPYAGSPYRVPQPPHTLAVARPSSSFEAGGQPNADPKPPIHQVLLDTAPVSYIPLPETAPIGHPGPKDEYKTGMQSLSTHQIIEGGACPARGILSTSAGVIGRMQIPQEEADAKTMVIADEYYGYLEEFATLLAGGVRLHPYDDEVVSQRMPRPQQRASQASASAERGDYKHNASNFLKAEAYIKLTDPRLIVTADGRNRIDFCKWTYPVADHLKKQPWYAFGRSCPEVAARVAKICVEAREKGWATVMTDYGRFDGTVSGFMRFVISRIYQELYPDYQVTVVEHLDNRYELFVFTSEGQVYFHGYAQLSGDNNTSILGTCCNAFACYCALRKSGLGPEEAYAALGIYGGDDGATACPDPDKLEEVGAAFGLRLEATIIRPQVGVPSTHVNFLARIYSHKVWFGDPSSCMDLPRQLRKVFLCTKLPNPYDVGIRLWEKAFAITLSDANTPLIGNLANCIVECSEFLWDRKVVDTTQSIAEFFGRYGRKYNWAAATAALNSSGYPNENHDNWMNAYAEYSCGSDIIGYTKYLDTVCLTIAENAAHLGGRGVLARMSSTKAKLAFNLVLEPVMTLSPMAIVPLKASPGSSYAVLQDGDIKVVEDRSQPLTFQKVDPAIIANVRRDLPAQYQAYSDILNGKADLPFPDLPPGARKCLFVAAKFCRGALATMKNSSGEQIIYSGAYSPKSLVPITQLLLASFPRAFRIILVDPAFRKRHSDPAVVEVSSYQKVTLRSTNLTPALFDECVAKSKNNGKASSPLFWLDDAFGDALSDSNGAYNKLKMELYNKYGRHLSFTSLKFRESDGLVLKVHNKDSISVYHTGPGKFFTQVVERRIEITHHGDEEVKVDWTYPCTTYDPAMALDGLFKAAKFLEKAQPPKARAVRDPGQGKGSPPKAGPQATTAVETVIPTETASVTPDAVADPIDDKGKEPEMPNSPPEEHKEPPPSGKAEVAKKMVTRQTRGRPPGRARGRGRGGRANGVPPSS